MGYEDIVEQLKAPNERHEHQFENRELVGAAPRCFLSLGHKRVSDIWPILVMCVWVLLVGGTVIQNTRLLRMFRNRYPQLAQKELPAVFNGRRDPEKAIYFFRRRAINALQPHADLWRERQRFVVLVSLTVGYLLLLAVTIIALGILLT